MKSIPWASLIRLRPVRLIEAGAGKSTGCWLMLVKSRSGNKDQIDRHRFERVAVRATDLIGRRERMRWRTASGRSEIRSPDSMFSGEVRRRSFLILADLFYFVFVFDYFFLLV